MQLNMRILKSVHWKKSMLQLCMINKNLQHSSFLSVWNAHRSGGPRRPTPPKLLPGSPIVPQTYLSWFHSTCLKLLEVKLSQMFLSKKTFIHIVQLLLRKLLLWSHVAEMFATSCNLRWSPSKLYSDVSKHKGVTSLARTSSRTL